MCCEIDGRRIQNCAHLIEILTAENVTSAQAHWRERQLKAFDAALAKAVELILNFLRTGTRMPHPLHTYAGRYVLAGCTKHQGSLVTLTVAYFGPCDKYPGITCETIIFGDRQLREKYATRWIGDMLVAEPVKWPQSRLDEPRRNRKTKPSRELAATAVRTPGRALRPSVTAAPGISDIPPSIRQAAHRKEIAASFLCIVNGRQVLISSMTTKSRGADLAQGATAGSIGARQASRICRQPRVHIQSESNARAFIDRNDAMPNERLGTAESGNPGGLTGGTSHSGVAELDLYYRTRARNSETDIDRGLSEPQAEMIVEKILRDASPLAGRLVRAAARSGTDAADAADLARFRELVSDLDLEISEDGLPAALATVRSKLALRQQ